MLMELILLLPSMLSPSILNILPAYQLDISLITLAFLVLTASPFSYFQQVRRQVAVCWTRSSLVDMKCRVRALSLDIISKTPH